MLPVTCLLAVCLAGLFQFLGILTIRRRRGAQVAVGDGGNEALTRAIRAQGNLAEYGLMFAGLIALAELNGAPWPVLAILAAAFLTGRASHAYGLLVAEPEPGRGSDRFRWRVRGMVVTLTAIPLAAATVLVMLAINALA